jgi:hypothetical protein
MTTPTDSRQRLAEALQLSRCLISASSHADDDQKTRWQKRLQQIGEELKAFAHPICRDRLAIEQIPLSVRQAFVKAAILLTRYHQLGGSKWQGSISSPTLSQYRPDPIPAKLAAPDALEQLCQVFALSSLDQMQIQTDLATIDGQIAQQQQLIQAVLADFSHPAIGEAGENSPYHLFQNLFGEIPIPATAITYVHTDMQLYFCIDFQDGELCDRNLWNSLSEAEQQQVRAFLLSLKQFSFEQFRRFPTFGPCDPQSIDRAWCDRIAQKAGCTCAEVVRSLSRSVGIIPTQKAEAFLVHDIWGHHWQLMLTQFESDYSILTTCHESLRAAETAYTEAGPLTCRELFEQQGDRVLVNEEHAKLFFHSEVRQRLGLLFTHLLGEMIADVAEFKFVWDCPQSANQLLSSSSFKTEPTKLDLTLADVDFLFLRVLRPLLEIRLSVLEDSPLETELLNEWLNYQPDTLELRTNLKVAIAQLHQLFLQEYNAAYLPTFTGEVGMFTQIVNNLLYLQNVINNLYTDPVLANNPHLPFQDLLIIFMGCYCSSDSYAEFWTIDDVLAAYFLPCWHWLDAGIL